ncbi:MAG TPA: PAS domain S-box protein [Marmoricola sp.]|nr:PAS domain S-box protein [Marmoricola sp.]
MTDVRLALVVDDDPDVAMVCALHLEGAGFDVLEATTGQAAVELARSATPGVIVLDYMLPDIDGVEVLARLRSDEATAAIPVVMLTARTHERDRTAAWDAGVSDYVTKPFEGTRLVSAVTAAMGRAAPTVLERRERALARLTGPDRGRLSALAAVVDGAQDAVVVTTLEGEITYWNGGAERMFGWRANEVIGGDTSLLTVPEGQKLNRHALAQVVDGKPVPVFELVCVHRDGTRFPGSLSVSPVCSGDGTVVAASAIVRDVTERVRLEGRFRSLVEAAPDAMVIVDGDGRIELVNKQTERIFGHSRDELLGQPFEMLVPERFHGRHPVLPSSYTGLPRQRGMGAGVDLYGLRADGTEFPVEVALSPLETEQGTSYAATVRDVTTRKRAEAAQVQAYQREREATNRLREVDRLRSDFLSTVSHELRTPLTAIKGFAEWLVSAWDETTDQRRKDMVVRILRAGGRLDFLIQDLLDFSRLERGHLKVEVHPHHLSSVVRETLQHVGPSLEHHELECRLDDTAMVYADREALTRVVENLLTNASKFAPLGSTVEVTSAVVGDEVRLSVRDHGIGIPEEEHEKVFDRFYRVPEIMNRHPGTGIGLAIVQQFTEAQGGHVTLSSKPGDGSEFTLHLRRAR